VNLSTISWLCSGKKPASIAWSIVKVRPGAGVGMGSLDRWIAANVQVLEASRFLLLYVTEERIDGFLHFFLVRPGMHVLVVMWVRCLARLGLGCRNLPTRISNACTYQGMPWLKKVISDYPFQFF